MKVVLLQIFESIERMLTEKKAGPSLNNKIEVETFVVAKKANLDECSRQSVNEQLNIFFSKEQTCPSQKVFF